MEWSWVLAVLGVAALGLALSWLSLWVYRVVEAALFVRRQFLRVGGSWRTPGPDLILLQMRVDGLDRRVLDAEGSAVQLRDRCRLLEQELGMKPEQRCYQVHGSVYLGTGQWEGASILAAAKKQGVPTTEPKPTVVKRIEALEKKKRR